MHWKNILFKKIFTIEYIANNFIIEIYGKQFYYRTTLQRLGIKASIKNTIEIFLYYDYTPVVEA